MLINQTIAKLNEMKLFGMVKGLEEQRANPEIGSLSFEERISLLIDREWSERESRKVTRLLREAKLKIAAVPEDIDYSSSRGLERSIMASLLGFDWIKRHHHIIITGPTGTGKTYLACAFGNGACRQGFRTYYYRVPKLLEEIKISRADGSLMRLLAKFSRSGLLILDDWGLSSLSESESKDLLEVIEEATGNSSLVVASQLPIDHWHEIIPNPTIADALLDRLIHNSYKFNLKGGSMRKNYAKLEVKSATL